MCFHIRQPEMQPEPRPYYYDAYYDGGTENVTEFEQGYFQKFESDFNKIKITLKCI